jgi:monoamine oxidase
MSKRNTLSRRRFLEAIGKIGGAAALYETMTALGMIQTTDAWAGPTDLAAGSGTGKTVVILGAGMGGMATAYQLARAGYDCVILEAQNRAGGRNQTARRGSVVIEQSPEHGRTRQECKFDDGLYLNLGPGRIPYHHRRSMFYCQELNVPLEVYNMTSWTNLYQTDSAFGGKPVTRARIASDTNSHIAELLAKAVNKRALDEDLSKDDQAAFLDLLRVYGNLPNAGGGYLTTSDQPRTGCVSPITVQGLCQANPRLPLKEMLRSAFWQHIFFQPLEGDWQATLFQCRGGNDKIVDGFKRQIGQLIRYQSEVLEIKLVQDGVEIVYRDRQTREQNTIRADYCVSSIPVPLLAKLKTNFSGDFKAAVDGTKFLSTYKFGWQANRRFWESDKYAIYGGISYTDHPITQMWYPSNDYLSTKGILAGSYAYGKQADEFGRMSLAERIRVAREGAAKLHDEFNSELIVPSDRAISINWKNVEFAAGGGALWDAHNATDAAVYKRLLVPDGRFFVVGDQASPVAGWMEGAFMSAEHVVGQIAGKRPTTVSGLLNAPETRRMMLGAL